MRLILVNKNDKISSTSGTSFVLKFSNFTLPVEDGYVTLSEGVNIYRCGLELEILSGGDVRIDTFLTKNVALTKKILPIACFYEDNEVVVVVKLMENMKFKASDPFVECVLVETVKFRQINKDLQGDMKVIDSDDKAIKVVKKPKRKNKN